MFTFPFARALTHSLSEERGPPANSCGAMRSRSRSPSCAVTGAIIKACPRARAGGRAGAGMGMPARHDGCAVAALSKIEIITCFSRFAAASANVIARRGLAWIEFAASAIRRRRRRRIKSSGARNGSVALFIYYLFPLQSNPRTPENSEPESICPVRGRRASPLPMQPDARARDLLPGLIPTDA